MWFQQALANESQAAVSDTQESMQEMASHINNGFKYGKLAGIAALVAIACFIFLAFAR